MKRFVALVLAVVLMLCAVEALAAGLSPYAPWVGPETTKRPAAAAPADEEIDVPAIADGETTIQITVKGIVKSVTLSIDGNESAVAFEQIDKKTIKVTFTADQIAAMKAGSSVKLIIKY